MILFLLVAAGMVGGGLLLGRFLRPSGPTSRSQDPYECGELPVGSSRVRFDLRFYAMALVFLVFDVEIALLYPWAVFFGTAAGAKDAFFVRGVALLEMFAFLGVLVVGFAYLWKSGYLDWIRSVEAQSPEDR
jgi:NADH-quinone oxidoreductase subunit A